MLLFPAFLGILAAAPILGTYARQIPVVDGVLGGVRLTASVPLKNLKSDKRAVTAGTLRIVEDSGVCGKCCYGPHEISVLISLDYYILETTPGVYQASGYGDIASDKSIW